VVTLFEADIFIAAASLVASRIIGTLLVSGYLARVIPQLPFGLQYANLKTFKHLLPASLGFMAMPIGYAFFIQGMVLIAASYSASYAAVFSTTRTLTSLGRQVVSMVAHASWPELSRAFGENNDV
jgi:O-antigen/teichoic acid export membrane protein